MRPRTIAMAGVSILVLANCSGPRAATPSASASSAPIPAAELHVAPPAVTPITPIRAVAPDPPPTRIALAADDEWNDRLHQLLAQEPAADDPTHVRWLEMASYVSYLARDYQRAEHFDRLQIDRDPTSARAVASLSVSLGKQGRYAEALQEADRAASMADANAMHVAAIRASWLWHLSRHEEAMAAFAAIPVPAPADAEATALYQGCRACFAASRHDLTMLHESIGAITAAGDDSGELFLARDVIFDQYRHDTWFVQLVGDTASPEL